MITKDKTERPNSSKLSDRIGQVVGLLNGVAIKVDVTNIYITSSVSIGNIKYGLKKYTVRLLARDCWVECRPNFQRSANILHNQRVDSSKDYYNRNALRSSKFPTRRLERDQSEDSMDNLASLISTLNY